MSVQTLYTAATGMDAMQTKLDVIANNLANVNTDGFKRGRANFEDLFYRHEMLPGVRDAASNQTATGISIGLGSRVAGIQTDFNTGPFQTTNGPLDLAIEGPGFFRVLDPSGEVMYTRAGNFSINANGDLVLGSAQTGRLLDPAINIPPDANGITISSSGEVSVRQPPNTAFTTVGQITLASFLNPEGLLKVGENLYSQTEAAGTITEGNPGTTGIGVVRQNALELSNVEPVRELIDLITTQRAFELNSQAVQAGDQILQLVAQLRRF